MAELQKPRCGTCIHFSRFTKSAFGTCELESPEQNINEENSWDQPTILEESGCSHHHDFAAYKLQWLSERKLTNG